MKSIRKLSAVLCLLVLGAVALSADQKVTKPRASEVVIVARIQILPGIDHDFFAHYAVFETPSLKATLGRSYKKGEIPPDTMAFFTKVSKWKGHFGNSIDLSGYESTPFGNVGDISMAKLVIPKNREIEIGYVRIYLADNGFLFFNVPVDRKIVIPADTNYVYLGTITCTLANEYFEISDLSITDEFDGAQAFIAKTFGPGAQLVRVNLLEVEKKK